MPLYNSYVAAEKLVKEREMCKFGKSQQSKMFIGIVAVLLIILFIIGMLIGHCLIESYKK
jgi:hypothetical protein